jgi:hypothetical protein
MDFDDRIFEAVRGGTQDKPRDLVDIFAYVDSREKVVLSQQELVGGLQRLIEQGRIGELSRHRFHEVIVGPAPRTFSGLTPVEYEQACEAYRKWFWKTYKELTKK